MSKINILSALLVVAATIGGLNFVANRLSFSDISSKILQRETASESLDIEIQSVGYLDHFTVFCGGIPTLVQPTGGAATSIACKCPSPVTWGSSTVSAGGYQTDDFGANVRNAYCIDSGFGVNCDCIALINSKK